MQQEYCQSCGMPMSPQVLGTNQDGSQNPDYCSYCYQKGAFTADTDMEGMINFCAPLMAQHNPDMTEDKAREMMAQFFPTLKRWRKA